MTAGCRLAGMFLLSISTALPCAAQTAPPASRPARLVVAGGGTYSGGYEVGTGAADLRQNTTGSGQTFTLFETRTRVDSAAGLDLRVGYVVSPAWTVEGEFTFSKPSLSVVVSNDREEASTSFQGQSLSQYVVGANVLWTVPGLGRATALRPYVLGGAGYLRQLYEDRTIVETGQVFYAGGGVRYLIRGAGARRTFGVRGEVRATVRRDGVEFEDATRVFPVASGLLFFMF